MAKKKRTTTTDRWASQAALQALLRFGPEESGLNELAREARDSYVTAVKQARGTGELAVNAVQNITPQMTKIYDAAGLDAARQSQSLIGKDLAALGGVANSIKAGGAIEAGQQLANLREARTQTLGSLAQRLIQARSGVQYATENARRQFSSDLGKLMDRRVAMLQEKGAFTALTRQQLMDEEAKLQQQADIAAGHDATSRGNAYISAGIDPVTGKVIPGGKADKKSKHDTSATGRPLLTPEKHADAANQLHDLVGMTQTWFKSMSRPEIIAKLRKGRPAVTAKGKDGTSVRLPEIKPTQITPVVAAALDMAQLGYITKITQRHLADQGYAISRLGVITAAEWKRRNPGKPLPRPKSRNGNFLSTVVSGVGNAVS